MDGSQGGSGTVWMVTVMELCLQLDDQVETSGIAEGSVLGSALFNTSSGSMDSRTECTLDRLER